MQRFETVAGKPRGLSVFYSLFVLRTGAGARDGAGATLEERECWTAWIRLLELLRGYSFSLICVNVVCEKLPIHATVCYCIGLREICSRNKFA